MFQNRLDEGIRLNFVAHELQAWLLNQQTMPLHESATTNQKGVKFKIQDN